MTPAPLARARRAVSRPMPPLPPITTTIWPSSSGSRWVDIAVAAVVMVPLLPASQSFRRRTTGRRLMVAPAEQAMVSGKTPNVRAQAPYQPDMGQRFCAKQVDLSASPITRICLRARFHVACRCPGRVLVEMESNTDFEGAHGGPIRLARVQQRFPGAHGLAEGRRHQRPNEREEHQGNNEAQSNDYPPWPVSRRCWLSCRCSSRVMPFLAR